MAPGSPDLYAIVGVEKTADAAEIRKAFRRRAKRAHPDVGGSSEEFERLTRAVSLLTDERRRKVYDETGKIEDAPVDNDLATAMQWVASAIDSVLNATQHLDPGSFDVLDEARRYLAKKPAEIDALLQKAEEQRAAVRKIAARFKAKSGKVDRIGPMILAKLTLIEQNVAKSHADKKHIARALELMNEHLFFVEPAARDVKYVGAHFFNFQAP